MYGDLEFVHNFEEDSAIAAYGYQFRSGLADSWTRLQAGVRKEFSPRVSATLSGGFGVGLDPDAESTSMWDIRTALRWALGRPGPI